MAGYPGNFRRVTRVGLTKTSGWEPLARSAFFTPSPPDQAANTFNDLTSAAWGAHAVGTGAATLEALTSASAGAIGAKGTGSATLAAQVSTASGSTVSGTSAATLAAQVSTATGTAAGGTSAATLAAITSTASGARGNAGTSAATLAASTSSAVGMLPPSGTGASVLADFYHLFRGSAHGPDEGLGTVTHTFTVGANLPTTFEWGGDTAGIGTIVEHPDAAEGTTGALQFPDIGDSQETYFEFWAWATPTNNTLRIRFETDSEGGYDYFRVYYQTWDFTGSWAWGTVVQGSGQGNGWQEFTDTLDEGDTRVRVIFFKDSSVSSGQDTAWISTLTYPYGDLAISGTGSATLGLLTASGVGRVSPRRVRRISLHGSTYIRTRAA